MSRAALLLVALVAGGEPAAQRWGGYTVTFEELGGGRYREAAVDAQGRTRVVRLVRLRARGHDLPSRLRPIDRAESWWPNGRRQALLERVPGGRSYLLWTTDGRLFVTASLTWRGEVRRVTFHDAEARAHVAPCPRGTRRWFRGPSGWMGVHPKVSELGLGIRTGCGSSLRRGQRLAWHPNGRLAAEWESDGRTASLRTWDAQGRARLEVEVDGASGKAACFRVDGTLVVDGKVHRDRGADALLEPTGRWRWWSRDGVLEAEIPDWTARGASSPPDCLRAGLDLIRGP